MATATLLERRFLTGLLLLAGLGAFPSTPYAGSPPWQPPFPGQWNHTPPADRPSTSGAPPSTRQRPAYGGWPAMRHPGYGQPGYYPTPSRSPRIEAELSLKRPYVEQGVILRLSLVSRNNLLTAVPRIPESDMVTLQLLEGPNTYSRTRRGQQEIVNDFFFEVIPLRAGALSLPPIRFSGEEEQISGYTRGSRRFDVSISRPLSLEVREADPASAPWLPLEQLVLRAELPDAAEAVAGKPLSLTLELTATGLGGNRLPSLESQLAGDAFRVYRDWSRVSTDLDPNTRKLTGRRIDHFTLVPQYGGDLRLPPLRIPWWNTLSDMPQRTSLPPRPIAVAGQRKPGGPFAEGSGEGPFLSGTSAPFWIPLGMIFGVIFSCWLVIWIAHRRRWGRVPTSPLQPLIDLLQRPMRPMAPAFSPLKARLRQTASRLNPVTRWHRWRRRLVSALPLPVRFWFCVRFVDGERDPEVWGFTLRFLANKHLGLPLNAPFSAIGEHILAFHPKADPLKIRDLIHRLEASVYGHRELDFEDWKTAFKHEIRPSLKPWPRASDVRTHRKPLLPGLNPGHIAGA